jgi:putative transposase
VPDIEPHARNLRKGRHSNPGLFYFLTASARDRRPVFADHRNATVVLETIRWLSAAGRFFADAAVIMPDHVHLAGELGRCTLANVMHALKGYSANRLARMGVERPIWQRAYHDHALRDEADYETRVRYLLENPVRAGLVTRVEDYPHVILPVWWTDPGVDSDRGR